MKEYSVVPNLMSVVTNIETIPYFLYGELSEYVRSDKHKIKIIFNVVDRLDIPVNDMSELVRFDYFSFDGNKIFFNHPFIFGIPLRFAVAVDSAGNFRMDVEERYLRMIKMRVENISPPGQHLFNLAQCILLQNGYATMHCAAFRYNEKGVILMAPSNTGKTYTTFQFVKRGAKILGEDIVVISYDGIIYSCPLVSVYSEYANERPPGNQYLNLMKQILLTRPKRGIQDKFKEVYQTKFIPRSTLDNIVILQRGAVSGIKKLDPSISLSMMITLNRHEFRYLGDGLLRAIDYFGYTGHSVEKAEKKEESIIMQLLNRANVYLVTGKTVDDFSEIIDDALF